MNNDKNYDFLNELSELDDEMVDIVAENCPYPDKSDLTLITRLCEEKLTMNENNIYTADVVDEPVERITKTPWHRTAFNIAASLVLIAGIGSAAFIGLAGSINRDGNMGADISDSVEQPTPSSACCRATENNDLEFVLNIPENAEGRFELRMNTYDESSDEPSYSYGEFSGSDECYLMGIYRDGNDSLPPKDVVFELTNLANGETAIVSKFHFDFQTGAITNLEEDVLGAFAAVGGLSGEELTTDTCELKELKIDETSYSLDIPENALASYRLKLVFNEGDEEKQRISTSNSEFHAGENATVRTVNIIDKPDGIDVPVTAYLINVDNGMEAVIGKYIFNYEKNSYTAIEEDADAAFLEVDGPCRS